MTLNDPTAGGRREMSDIFELSDQYIVESCTLDPMMATFWGVPGHDDEMTDYSPDGWAARLELQHRTIRNLERMSPAVAAIASPPRSCASVCEAESDLIESGEYHRWLNVLNSHHQYVREVFDFMPRESDEDWTNIRRRLAAVPRALDSLRASFVHAAGKGEVSSAAPGIGLCRQLRHLGATGRCILRHRRGV